MPPPKCILAWWVPHYHKWACTPATGNNVSSHGIGICSQLLLDHAGMQRWCRFLRTRHLCTEQNTMEHSTPDLSNIISTFHSLCVQFPVGMAWGSAASECACRTCGCVCPSSSMSRVASHEPRGPLPVYVLELPNQNVSSQRPAT